jgi:hypothetical protein
VVSKPYVRERTSTAPDLVLEHVGEVVRMLLKEVVEEAHGRLASVEASLRGMDEGQGSCEALHKQKNRTCRGGARASKDGCCQHFISMFISYNHVFYTVASH